MAFLMVGSVILPVIRQLEESGDARPAPASGGTSHTAA
jgi:hypothetical protein